MKVNDEEKKLESIDQFSEINTNASNNDKSESDNEEKSERSPKKSTPEKKSQTVAKNESLKEELISEKNAKKVHNFFSEYQ